MPRLSLQLIALLLILVPGCMPSEDGLSMPSWDEDNDGVRNECDVDYLLEYTDNIATYVVRLQSDILSQLVTMRIPVNIIP